MLMEVTATARPEWAGRALSLLSQVGKLHTDTPDPRIIEFFVRTLEHPDPHIRRQVALTLGRLGDVRAVDALIDLLRTRESRGSP